jgi:hypothetical protein
MARSELAGCGFSEKELERLMLLGPMSLLGLA